MAIDLTYLKKRAELLKDTSDSFNDEKIQLALSKIEFPKIVLSNEVSDNNGFEAIVHNKLFRNWIDLIPDSDKGFIKFIYIDGNDNNIDKYIRLSMIKPAYFKFENEINIVNENDFYLAKYILWQFIILKKPIGINFANFEMNQIFNNLDIDISKDKIDFDRELSFSDFYKQIYFAKWALKDTVSNVD